MNEKIVLASTSPYRKELLSRLEVPFSTIKPQLNEDAEKLPHWSPLALAQRLAYLKAASLLGEAPTIIGGDQLVSFKGKIIGKPGTFEKALETLHSFSGEWHELITAMCIIHQNRPYAFVDITRMKMKRLSDHELETYLKTDNPLDCAGGYKIEAHGQELFESIESEDFTAIQGLPLKQTALILNNIGYNPRNQ